MRARRVPIVSVGGEEGVGTGAPDDRELLATVACGVRGRIGGRTKRFGRELLLPALIVCIYGGESDGENVDAALRALMPVRV